MKRTKRAYPLGDRVPGVPLLQQRHYRALPTGEFRQVSPGEWYLSGAIPHAYRYRGDVPWLVMHIAKIVKETICTSYFYEEI